VPEGAILLCAGNHAYAAVAGRDLVMDAAALLPDVAACATSGLRILARTTGAIMEEQITSQLCTSLELIEELQHRNKDTR
jgi:hypothetical protein